MRAHSEFAKFVPKGGPSISQKLRNEARLENVLGAEPSTNLQARTIHEVKGKEYPAVCVVITTASLKSILTHLEDEPNDSWGEVGGLKCHLEISGTDVKVTDI